MAQNTSFTFTTPLNVNIVNLKDGEHLYVEGNISTTDIDLVNDIMTKECQESMQKQILSRNMKLDLEHEAFKGDTHEEKEINKTKIPAGKIIDATVKDLGNGRYSTSIKGEINRHNKDYKSIKGNLVDRYLDAFSVAFLPTDITYTKIDGKNIRLLNNVKLLNVALTGNPCNTAAQLEQIFTKSMDAVEDYRALKELDPTIEGKLEVKNHSNSILHKENKQLNKQTNFLKTMTEDYKDVKVEDESKEVVEQKSTELEMKELKESNEEVLKDNIAIKESMSKINETLKEIIEALNKPIHKSQGSQIDTADKKADDDFKSVSDPLELCN